MRFALDLHFLLYGLRHAIKGGADRACFESAQKRQTKGEVALLYALQAAGDDGKCCKCPFNKKERDAIEDHQHCRPEGEKPRKAVPGIEHGAR